MGCLPPFSTGDSDFACPSTIVVVPNSWMVKKREDLMNMDDLEVPLFQETTIFITGVGIDVPIVGDLFHITTANI